ARRLPEFGVIRVVPLSSGTRLQSFTTMFKGQTSHLPKRLKAIQVTSGVTERRTQDTFPLARRSTIKQHQSLVCKPRFEFPLAMYLPLAKVEKQTKTVRAYARVG